jgi:FMN phosphatase YigB (HAD superfamily)
LERKPLGPLRPRGWFGSDKIASIQLRGYPYEQKIHGRLQNSTDVLQQLAFNEKYRQGLEIKIIEHTEDLMPLYSFGFHGLDALVKSVKPLTYGECFSLGTYVCLASNEALYDALASKTKGYTYGLLEKNTLRLQAVSLLQAMSTRESIIGLQPQEIAGLVAATLELDTVVRVKTLGDLPTFTFGGMGGDRGLKINGEQSKLFSVSTLAALALADFAPVHKHHSYPNTSRVAGQSAIEAMGARSDFVDSSSMYTTLDIARILMTSCHSTRTLHTISHALKGETINHVIGPVAVPHSETNDLNAVVGVNHNIHPETIIQTLKILQDKGIQRYGNSIAICGIEAPIEEVSAEVVYPDNYYANYNLKSLVAIDEVPPPPYTTMASFLVHGENAGTFLIAPTDFMEAEEVRVLENDHLLIPNTTEGILAANENVINGSDHVKCRYVAMTVALALFAKEYASLPNALDKDTSRVNPVYLKRCYQLACAAMFNGNLEKRVKLYSELSQKDVLPDIDLVILDIDNTLVKPIDPNFYKQYGESVNMATSDYLGVSLDEGKRVADYYRQNFGGGEMALFSGTIGRFFPEYGERQPNLELLYDRMCSIDSTGQFRDDGITAKLISLLRSQGKKVVAITDSPEGLSRRILAETGIDPDQDFDLYLPYKPDQGPLKIVQRGKIFERVANYFSIQPERSISIGDSYRSDIEPAEQLGMKACLISSQSKIDYSGLQVERFYDVFKAYRNNL